MTTSAGRTDVAVAAATPAGHPGGAPWPAPVIVGLDGSPAGVTAAWWAAREATLRRLPVVLLHSWTTQPLDVRTVPQEARSKERYGREILHRTAAELLHRYGDLELGTDLVSAPAARELVERGTDASLLVLGTRGHGSVEGFLLGSVSLHALGLARCPAVAVRPGDPAVENGWAHPAAADRDEVVVGVREPGPAADPLLEFAFAEASSGGTPVRVLRVVPRATLWPARTHRTPRRTATRWPGRGNRPAWPPRWRPGGGSSPRSPSPRRSSPAALPRC
ncbi:universal stress protein [Streptomyces sp. 11x1]|uniref:universal stress protein n=1 Tax=Streptomyces sp. 11x1 TaxID=3038642 RepID=UPI00292E2285|nr:universal stress protein [Streptomyces sp. 11x1]WNZ06641.1 universal stress protein [Streptomyces sp. 11x1]